MKYFPLQFFLQDADNRTERTFGDITQRKKYSHVDLIHMIGGMDADRGAVTAGNRGYYLMVRPFRSQSNLGLMVECVSFVFEVPGSSPSPSDCLLLLGNMGLEG